MIRSCLSGHDDHALPHPILSGGPLGQRPTCEGLGVPASFDGTANLDADHHGAGFPLGHLPALVNGLKDGGVHRHVPPPRGPATIWAQRRLDATIITIAIAGKYRLEPAAYCFEGHAHH